MVNFIFKKSVICEGFMTSDTINVFNRQNTAVFTQLEAKIITQVVWNGLMFSSAIIIWLHFRRAFLHYYGKQRQAK